MAITKEIDKKIRLLLRADEGLSEGINNLENDIYNQLVRILRDLDSEGGRFLSTDRNASVIARFSDDVLAALQSGRYRTTVDNWISTFDDIDEINGSIFNTLTGQITTDTIRSLTGPVRSGLVNDIVYGLTSYPSLESSIVVPLRRSIMRNIVLGVTYKDAEDNLRAFLGKDPDKLGHINRWAIQLTRDGLNQYDGASQKKISDELGLNAFMFVGSIQDNSRLGCRHMVGAPLPITYKVGSGKKAKTRTEANRFSDIVRKDGGFNISDIPIIISRNSSDSGWNPNTSEESYLAIRNGYNCNHNAIPYLGSSEDQSKQLSRAKKDLA